VFDHSLRLAIAWGCVRFLLFVSNSPSLFCVLTSLSAQFCFTGSFKNGDAQDTLISTKLVMAFICILYDTPFADFTLRPLTATAYSIHCRYLKRAYQSASDLLSLMQHSEAKKDFMRSRGMFRGESSLAIACYLDCCSELLMDSFCLLINLWMVFGAIKPLDMVLNSLALEFIKSIGNIIRCEFIFRFFPHARLRQ
jgi:hypothetical protein